MRSSRVDTFTLVTLGRLTLVSPNGVESESLAKRRLKLSVLAVLATAKRPLSRSTLAEMFWGDQDESRARHSLSDALSHLRRELGRSAITTRDAEVSLASDAPVVMDAARFADAVGARNFARAAELYTGPFLDGVEIEAAESFEHWVTRERRRLETIFLEACAHQCLAHARAREWDACGALASRWLDAAPLSVDAALYRLNAVKASGTREAAQRALDEYEQLTGRLARDFDLAPEKPVRLLAESIREHLDSLPQEPTAEVSAAQVQEATVLALADESVPNVALPVDSVQVPAAALTAAKPGWQRRLIRLTSGTVAGAVLIGALAANARTPEPSNANRPRVAIALDVPVKDSATAWLGDGLPQMIVSQLSRSISLAGTDPLAFDLFARILVMTRRYDMADSLIALWLTSPRPELRATAYDVNVLLLRERGQYRAPLTALDRLRAESPNVTAAAPDLMQAATLGRLGDCRGAAGTYERVTHLSDSAATFPPRGTSTRGFCWHHALLADAIAASGETKRLTAIADTLEIGCARSFYGRDRVLYHHVRGLVASSRGHWLLAAAELRAARWGVSEAWTRTNVALSKAELVLGQPRAAVATLRDAYTAPLDGMGRYQPRSELDFLMAQAFEKAGESDSAAVYNAYARRAWRNADPEVKRLLEH